MFLDNDEFRRVVAVAPLISIDLVVRSAEGTILLGERLNRPAQGFWFVPGGRIRKNETLDAAFRRLSMGELGTAFERAQARLLDVYEHFYEDSVFGRDSFAPNTHYVVAGYLLDLPVGQALNPPREQHGHYRWWSPGEMRDSDRVHENTRAYLRALV
jgi:colanic acid biosynthesis protein WcaH